MAFVKMDWIKQFRFTGTPIIVIFDNNGRVLWHRGGILNEDDYKSAERTIVKNAKG
jgi:thioredoxin-related protein